jgi:hypothetical protein
MRDELLQRIRQLEAEAKRAIAVHERGTSRLYVRSRPAGRRIARYGEEQMRELLGDLNAQRNRALIQIEREAQELLREASREAEMAGEFPPDHVLSGSERDAVSERLALVERDVASLRDVELEARLRGVLRSGSKVDQYAYWSVARRLAREARERQGREGRASGQPNTSYSVRGTKFDEVLSELEDAVLGEERTRRTEKARGVVGAANDVLRQAYLARHDAKSPYGVVAKYHRPAEPITRREDIPPPPSAAAARSREAPSASLSSSGCEEPGGRHPSPGSLEPYSEGRERRQNRPCAPRKGRVGEVPLIRRRP